MKSNLVSSVVIALCSMWSSNAQCLNGGCELGLSKSQSGNDIFIGHYENGDKHGLGITYTYNLNKTTISYSDYIIGKKNGVQYKQTLDSATQILIHTFQNYDNDIPIYPALRITKDDNKTKIEVAFTSDLKWSKYDGEKKIGDLKIANVIHNGSPTFIAMNKSNQVLAISATVNTVKLLSSLQTEKYYNPLQLESKDNKLAINTFPKDGTEKTVFRTHVDWDKDNADDGLWVYKRYSNDELSYRFTYEDFLELPSAQDIKQQKLQKAFDFIAEQVDDYDFNKGYQGKVKDFMDILTDIKERAERKGLTISPTYDITMIRLHLENGDKDNTLRYAQTACIKSSNSYDLINDLITTRFVKHVDLLPLIKQNRGIAISDN